LKGTAAIRSNSFYTSQNILRALGGGPGCLHSGRIRGGNIPHRMPSVNRQ